MVFLCERLLCGAGVIGIISLCFGLLPIIVRGSVRLSSYRTPHGTIFHALPTGLCGTSVFGNKVGVRDWKISELVSRFTGNELPLFERLAGSSPPSSACVNNLGAVAEW